MCSNLLWEGSQGKEDIAADSPIMVNDEADGLKEHSVLGIGMLHLLGLRWFLGLIQNRLQALGQAASHSRVFWAGYKAMGRLPRSPPCPPSCTPEALSIKSPYTGGKRVASNPYSNHLGY